MLMKSISLIFGCWLFSSAVLAQAKWPNDTSVDFIFKFDLGAADFSLQSLNTVLAADGFPNAFNKVLFQGGGEMIMENYPISKRRFFNGIGINFGAYTANGSDLRINGSVYEGDYSFNYLVLRNKYRFFYPSLTVSLMGFDLKYFHASQHPDNFQDALTNFDGERSLTTGLVAAIKPGIHYEWEVNKQKDMLIGIQAFYYFGVGSSSWRLEDGYKLPGSPRAHVNGFSTGVALTFD
jgi:hypothetical protein